MKNIKIADKLIGADHKPFIIAEMSANHNQSLERALKIVDEAAKCGVDAVKIQTATPDGLTLNINKGEFVVNDGGLWDKNSLYELYTKAHTPWEWHQPIFKRCQEHGIIGFSSPFELEAVDFLESLDVPLYKIASFEMVDLHLIRKVAATGKPMIISTGMATAAEIDETVHTAHDAGCKNIILLKCTSTYPATPKDSNVITIPHMREMTQCQVGLSDHTMGIGAAVAAVAFGATVIEKHFTLKRADGGVDSTFSLEPDELKSLVIETERAFHALGKVTYGSAKSEQKSKLFRRSLYIVQDMKSGDILTKENLRIIRPGFGLSPKYYDVFLGKKVSKNIKRGTPANWELI